MLVALDPVHGADIVAAHRASVAASIAYLEDRAVLVRDRRRGQDLDVPATWERIVSFTHGVNRHGEPHLHDHVLVGARPAGAQSVLDGRALFTHRLAADALYRSSLRLELRQRTPWTAWRSFAGTEHVEGLDEGYRALWCGHHRGRGVKLCWSRRDAVTAWRRDQDRLETVGTVSVPSRDKDVLDEHSFAGALEGRVDVARRHLVAAWADAATFGQSSRDVGRSVDALFPGMTTSRGVRESTIGVHEARMIALVRERGPRPLERDDLVRWCQRSRERSDRWLDRSR